MENWHKKINQIATQIDQIDCNTNDLPRWERLRQLNQLERENEDLKKTISPTNAREHRQMKRNREKIGEVRLRIEAENDHREQNFGGNMSGQAYVNSEYSWDRIVTFVSAAVVGLIVIIGAILR